MKKLILGLTAASLCALAPISAFAGPLEDGIAAIQKKDYATARTWLEPLAVSGDKNAQFFIAGMYQYGLGGFSRSKFKALDYYEKSAEQGFVPAYKHTADMHYGDGGGIGINLKWAFDWYTKIPDNKKSAEVHYRMGQIFSIGRHKESFDAPPDYVQAANSFLKASEKGHVDAQVYLGSMYDKGQGVPKSKDHAINWLKKAAAQGDNRAIRKLARLSAQ